MPYTYDMYLVPHRPAYKVTQFKTSSRDDYKYVTPILKKEAIDKEYLKSFEDLQKLLKRLQKTLSGAEAERNYVYLLPSVLCGIIVPAEVEEAIRDSLARE